MLAALGQEILDLGHQDPFPVVIEVGDITGEVSKVGHELFWDFEYDLPNGMLIHLVGLGFVLDEALVSVTGGTEKTLMMAMENVSVG